MSTPGEQERVRRLLRDLAHTDQVDPPAAPPDVTARLDAALAAEAGSGSGSAAPATPAAVVPLRRRVAPWLAAAAAVVVVGGLGTAALTSGDGDGDSAAGGASSSADTSSAEGSTAQQQPSASPDETSQDETREPAASADAGGSEESGGPEESEGSGSSGDTRVVEMPALSARSLTTDTEQLLAAGEIAGAGDAMVDAAERDRLQGSGCVVPDPARGDATFVALDGDPAVLLVGPVEGGERAVEALACADGSTVARGQVPADAAGR
ncbi:hypothetical protein [Nocardioides aequoreus]|uniref:hypothetical protein n=1 Tax=Nocardioides aequoreus TaxID=397278 RepID=UPI0004C2EF6F|nr:hypothetical protein [Nocardioides aequoreus]